MAGKRLGRLVALLIDLCVFVAVYSVFTAVLVAVGVLLEHLVLGRSWLAVVVQRLSACLIVGEAVVSGVRAWFARERWTL